MFLLLGINSKVKDCGMAPDGVCPVCGAVGGLHISNKYMTPHIFFIPTFRFDVTYLATCRSCASVMELRKEKGKAVERGNPVEIRPEDLAVLQNNAVPVCPSCGSRQSRESRYCNKCGTPL